MKEKTRTGVPSADMIVDGHDWGDGELVKVVRRVLFVDAFVLFEFVNNPPKRTRQRQPLTSFAELV